MDFLKTIWLKLLMAGNFLSRVLGKLIHTVWQWISLAVIALIQTAIEFFPVAWRHVYRFGEQVISRILRAISGCQPVFHFLREEYFLFIGLLRSAFAHAFSFLWSITPQRMKPLLVKFIPFWIELKRTWFWCNRAVLSVLRLVLKDMQNSYAWLKGIYHRQTLKHSLDPYSIRQYGQQFKEKSNKNHIIELAQLTYREYRTILRDHWQDFNQEIQAIWERLKLLRNPNTKSRTVELLSPFAKEKRDVLTSSIIINTLALAFPLLMLQLYDRILPHQSVDTLFIFAIVVGFAVLVESYVRSLRSSLTSWIAARFEHNAMLALTERFLCEPLHLFERKGTGAIMEDYKSISTLKYHYSGQTFQQLMDLPFTVVYVLIAFLINFWIGLLLFMGYTIFIFITWKQGREAPLLAKQQKEGDLRRANFLNEILKNIHTLKSITMEALMQRRYERLQEACAKLMSKITYSTDMTTGIGNVFSPLMTILVTALGAYLVVNGQMTNGELAACILLGMRSLAPLQRLGSIWSKYQQDEILRDKLAGILKKPGLIELQILDEEPTLKGKEFDLVPAGITLEKIRYRYHLNQPEIFNDLNLVIHPGEFILIGGSSGSGRSTLMQLLSGQIQPDFGQILLGGKDVADFQASTYADRVAYLSSNATLFEGTLLDNITVFDPDRMTIALQLASQLGLSEFVAKLPRGWDTQVGDMATETLSPGYRQRISIVRALASQPNVILFDNASSAMDAEGDKLLLNLIQSFQGKVTIVMVTNRQAFASIANRIIYLRDGKAFEAEDVEPHLVTEESVVGTQETGSVGSNAMPMVAMPTSYQPVAPEVYFKPHEYSETDEQDQWRQMQDMVGANFKEITDLVGCLVLLLKLMYSKYTPREVAESLPYYADALDMSGFQNAMAQLGFVATSMRCRLIDLDTRSFPCLFIPEEGPGFVVIGRLGSQMRIGNDATTEPRLEEDLSKQGHAYFYKKVEQSSVQGKSWCLSALWRFRPLILQAGFSALISGVITIVGTLFLMAVYGTIIPSGSKVTLAYLTFGSVVAMLISYYFIRHRARILSFIGGRIEYLFGSAILQHLLRMPTSYTERASVGSQISRLQSFESIRDLFTGPLAATFLEMPATIVLLIGLSYINPIALLLFSILATTYAILYWGFFDQVHKRGLEVGNTSTKRNQFLIEMTAKMRAIRECGAQYVWLDRFREISANATMAGFRAEQISSFLVSISYFLMMAAAILIVSLTTPAVLNQSLASGVLVASMMLMWRVLNPIQTVFVSMSRIERVRGAVRQIDALMAIQGERTENTMPPVERGMKGKIEFARVSFRYTTHADPALTGVEFRIEPGKMVAISGANGGGKSTVLKLMLGLYQPQAGSVLIDNVDIRQLDSFELRRLIGYAPQDLHLFRASIAQNLRLARPDATDNEIYQALDMAGALEQTLALPRGLDFRVGDNTDDIPATLRHKIILARAYITRAPIMLFDEPGAGLDEIGEFKFIKALEMLKGKATVVFISHSPKHIMMADTLMVFDKGFLRAAAPPADLLKPPAPPAPPPTPD